MRVAILVVCVEDGGDHSLLARTIKETWGKTANEDVEIWYLWGNGRKIQDHNDFILDMADGYGTMLRSILAFLFSKRGDRYDYVLKVNTGSYVDVKRLVAFLEDKPREKFYCGSIGRYQDIVFVSGSGIILSWDLCMLMVNNIKKVNFAHIDDIAIGQFMQKRGINIDDRGIRVTYHGEGKILQVGENVIPERDFDYDKVYHYRLRNNDKQRNVDCDHMKRLYKQLHLCQ